MEDFPTPPVETKEQRMRRMLGLRDFPKRTIEEKRVLLGSDERLEALERITTTTLPVSKKEMKKGAVLEIIEKNLISLEILRNNPLVYVGSGTDVEYPLALGGRNIIMVDPILADEVAAKEVLGKIKSLIKDDSLGIVSNKLSFDFDFGYGKEFVEVTLVTQPYEDGVSGYVLPEQTGTIVLYASQGPGGVVRINDDMKSKVVDGGAILEDTEIHKIDRNNGVEVFQLGE